MNQPDTWFDRTICPEPCGAMHERYTETGAPVDHCPVEAEPAAPAAVVAPPTSRAAVLLWAADQIDAETRQAKTDGVLEPWKFRPCRDASAQLRRLAAEAQQQTDIETHAITRATRYTSNLVPEDSDLGGIYAITVEYRGDDRWAVLRHGLCLSSDGRWDRERVSTEREEEWLAAHRFDLDTALRLAEEQAAGIAPASGRAAPLWRSSPRPSTPVATRRTARYAAPRSTRPSCTRGSAEAPSSSPRRPTATPRVPDSCCPGCHRAGSRGRDGAPAGVTRRLTR